jgi:predicted DsbA family dithiol-disulfide isomerase
MRVDIWSDLVCPWCYLGKRRFDKALSSLSPDTSIEVVHRSFQLDPSLPVGQSLPVRDMLMRKYRLTPRQVEDMDLRMTQTAVAEGLDFHLEGTVTGNTAAAHQLVHLAADHGLQDTMIERLYRAYFVEQASIFDHDALVVLADGTGVDPAEAAAALRDERYAAAVARDLDAARRLGITGVPFFVIDGRLGVSGAQSPDVFLAALQRAATERLDPQPEGTIAP